MFYLQVDKATVFVDAQKLGSSYSKSTEIQFVQLLKELLNKFYAFFNALGIGFHSFLVHRKFFSFPWK